MINLANSNRRNNPRAVAALIIRQVCRHHHSLNTVLQQSLQPLSQQDRALCQHLCYGVLRFQPQLENIERQLLRKPLRNKDSDISALIQLGLYQLRTMRLPDHAAISETVNACEALGKVWAKKLVNATLRQYQRHSEQYQQQLRDDKTAYYAHPEWLIHRIQQDWPDQWQAILIANNAHPPLFLRVNQQYGCREQYLHYLEQHNITATPVVGCHHGILLSSAIDISQLPFFDQGAVSVQDGAAQWVAQLMAPQSQQSILDACAAPGGKTCHLLEIAPDSVVTALDIASDRVEKIQQNLTRLKLTATCHTSDALDTSRWWSGQLFDQILIDAPCSGSGVIRRHPDIKQLRRPDDIDHLARVQQQLLAGLWPLLAENGRLFYTTCSIFKQENSAQIAHFLATHPEAEEVLLEPEPATRQQHGYQRLPGEQDMDGFFYACLRRR